MLTGESAISIDRSPSLTRRFGHPASCSFARLRGVQVLLIYCLTPTHEAPETLLQELCLALCHFLKDDLVVVLRILLTMSSINLMSFTPALAVSTPVPF